MTAATNSAKTRRFSFNTKPPIWIFDILRDQRRTSARTVSVFGSEDATESSTKCLGAYEILLMETVVVVMGIEHEGLHAFKKVDIVRPHVGELINDQDLIWQVKEVRLMTGKKHIGVALEPFGKETKAAVADPTGGLLRKAGWEGFRPKAGQN